MISFALCALAFAVTFWAGRRSLGKGLVALLFFGYLYGIIRANLLSSVTYFVFDLGVIGLYLSQFAFPSSGKVTEAAGTVKFWVLLLILWPLIVVFMPYQPLLVSLVGLRDTTFFIPMLILGTRLREKDLTELGYGMIGLNLIAVSFAAAEYFLGLPRFYPRNAVTQIIYASFSAGDFYRIPATFINAHAYGGTMADSLPFLLALWNRSQKRIVRWLTILCMAVALLGVLMSAARLCFLMAAVVIVAALFTIRMSIGRRIIFLLIIAGMGVVTMGNERLQRFKALGDTDFVTNRVAGSVNRGFWEILAEHPMGNGLGGGGTSIPAFLEGGIRNPIAIENEYARILAEQGIVGLVSWLGFIVWFLTRAPVAFRKGSWDTGRRTGWCLSAFSVCTAWIGIGLFSSIPGTVMMLLLMGWTAVPVAAELRTLRGQRPVPAFGYGNASAPSMT
ncbi:MAG TPA: hypothetical protein VLY24_13160 [Bryobacteraceae bacterium]|nr:hypothetical protein [Bryobacteraceae bacterium]